jgi:predicted nucleic acid-binding protein
MELHRSHELWLSALVIGELRRGIELIRRRDQTSATVLETWFGQLCDDFGDRILPVTAAVAERWGRLNVPDPMPVIDGLLAATALEHRLVLVSRNVEDLARTGAELVNPFTA